MIGFYSDRSGVWGLKFKGCIIGFRVAKKGCRSCIGQIGEHRNVEGLNIRGLKL